MPNATPDWQRNLSFEETKKSCLQHVRDSILKFRNRIHIWDVINEAHVQPDNEPGQRDAGFHQGAERGAHGRRAEDGPRSRPHVLPHRQLDRDLVRLLHGPPARSLAAERVRLPENGSRTPGSSTRPSDCNTITPGATCSSSNAIWRSFKGFGKPIHITELGFSSSSDNVTKSEWWGGGVGGARILWRGERFTEETQAQWFETFYKIAFSKPYVDAITWWDFTDPGFIPNGGLLRADFTPKPSYERLLALQTKWKEEGILASVGAQTDAQRRRNTNE